MSFEQLYKIMCSDCGSDSGLIMCKNENDYEFELCYSCIEERRDKEAEEDEEEYEEE